MSNSLIDGNYMLMEPLTKEKKYKIINNKDNNVNFNNINVNLKVNNNVRDENNNNILHQILLTSMDENDAISKLYNIDFNISNLYNSRNDDYKTPLHLLCEKNFFKLYKILIGDEKKIDKDDKDTVIKYFNMDVDNVSLYKDNFDYFVLDNNKRLPLYYLFKNINDFNNIKDINYFKYIENFGKDKTIITANEEDKKLYYILIDNNYKLNYINKEFIDKYFEKVKDKRYIIDRSIINEIYKITYKDFYKLFLDDDDKDKTLKNNNYPLKNNNYLYVVSKFILKKLEYEENFVNLNYVISVIDYNIFTKNINILISMFYKNNYFIRQDNTQQTEIIKNLTTKINDAKLNDDLTDDNIIKILKDLTDNLISDYTNPFNLTFNKTIKDNFINFQFIYQIIYYTYQNKNNNEIINFIKENKLNNINAFRLFICIKLILDNKITIDDLNKPIYDIKQVKYNSNPLYDNIRNDDIKKFILLNNYGLIHSSYLLLNKLLNIYPSMNYCIDAKLLLPNIAITNPEIKNKLYNNIKFTDFNEHFKIFYNMSTEIEQLKLVSYFLSIYHFNNRHTDFNDNIASIKDLIIDFFEIKYEGDINKIEYYYNIEFYFIEQINYEIYNNNDYKDFRSYKPPLNKYYINLIKSIPKYNNMKYINAFNKYIKEHSDDDINKNNYTKKYKDGKINIDDFLKFAFNINYDDNFNINNLDNEKIKNTYQSNIYKINNIILKKCLEK